MEDLFKYFAAIMISAITILWLKKLNLFSSSKRKATVLTLTIGALIGIGMVAVITMFIIIND